MIVQRAKTNPQGVKIFYILSNSGHRYTAQFIRRAGMRRWDCTCPDFTYRRQAKGSYRACKHIHFMTCTGKSIPKVRKMDRS